MSDFRVNRSLKGRKAQLTAFIIIGILLMAIAGVYLYIVSYAKKSEAERIVEEGLEITLDEAKIKEYITACIKKEGKELADKISEQGGTLSLNQFRYYFNVKYNYFCISKEGFGCINRLITRQSMAQELNNALKTKLKECVDFEKFRNEGYNVKEEEIDVKTTVGVNDVNFEVIYPVTISREGKSITINDFTADIASKLGTLYDLAVKIVYDEERKGSFDEDRWMLEHGQIQIEKHKPYPDIVYSLKIEDKARKTTEIFNFGLKGRYTVYDIGKPSKGKTSKGYCKTKDKNCYANVDQGECVKARGEWSSSPFSASECIGLSTYSDPACEGEECRNCRGRKHGESWCEYEGITSPGFSLVGSRHYKGSCINGKIYYTECRDYREEICIDNDMIDVPKAACRINRWQDCAKQKNRESCMDNSARDCWWSDWLVLNRQQKCIPYIPPGFMHWQMNGNEVCSIANEQFDCNYYTCGQSWVDSTALYCYFMGDCGNYRNTEKEITYDGFFNVDSAVSDYVYLDEKQLDLETKPRLKMEAESIPRLDGTEYENPHGDINQIINNEIRYMDEVANWKFEDFRYTYLTEGKVYGHVLQTSLCMPWQAPYKGKDCRDCGGPNRPCTEYKCRSLGQTCTYEEINGIGFCYDYSEKDKTPPELFFDGTVYGDFEIKKDFFGKTKGYGVSKPLQPYAPLFFILNATEPVRCKITSLPQPKYDQIPLPSSPIFERFYAFTDIVPKPIDFRIGLMQSVGVENFLEFGTFESYDAKFRRLIYDARKFVKEFEGALDKEAAVQNIDRVEQLWDDEVAPNIRKVFNELGDTLRDLAIQTEQGNKLIFFKCVDKAGNENEEDIFLKYKIGKDKTPPLPLGVFPANNTNVTDEFVLRLFVNEPANCRFARSDMGYNAMPLENEIECTVPSFVNLARVYECYLINVEASEGPKTDLYIRCMDKPTAAIRYKFNLTKGDALSHGDVANAMSTILMEDDRRINLTPQWEQYFKLPDIKEITVEADENEIVINSVGEEFDCKYSLEPGIGIGRMESMECGKIEESIYQCNEMFNVADSLFVEIACLRKFEEEERNVNKDSTILSYSNLP